MHSGAPRHPPRRAMRTVYAWSFALFAAAHLVMLAAPLAGPDAGRRDAPEARRPADVARLIRIAAPRSAPPAEAAAPGTVAVPAVPPVAPRGTGRSEPAEVAAADAAAEETSAAAGDWSIAARMRGRFDSRLHVRLADSLVTEMYDRMPAPQRSLVAECYARERERDDAERRLFDATVRDRAGNRWGLGRGGIYLGPLGLMRVHTGPLPTLESAERERQQPQLDACAAEWRTGGRG